MTPTNHPRLRELLAAILAAPEDDGPRLAYADALAELGDGDRAAQERAEFVRVQIALAPFGDYHGRHWAEGRRCPGCGTETNVHENRCRWLPFHRRERELWFAPLVLRELPDASVVELHLFTDPGDVRPGGGYVQGLVRRGFVESLAMPASALPHLDAVRACQPVVKVTLTTWPDPTWLLERAILAPEPTLAHAVDDAYRANPTRYILERIFSGVTFELPTLSIHGTPA